MGQAKTLSLGSTADLVVQCPWVPGIIGADEPILPRTRLAITFRTLFELRKRAREALEPAFADPIERLERIHSFRLAAEMGGLRLSVTYDFGWELYMRALKEQAGPFLDLLCCHCEGYRLTRETSLDEWQGWIRKNQVQSDYFYSASALTVGDLAALSQGERLQRDEADIAKGDRSLAGFASMSAQDLAEIKRLASENEAQMQAITVIVAMHRLTRYWTADVAKSVIPKDAITLLRATRELIEHSYGQANSLNPAYERSFKSQLDWYRQPIPESGQPARPAQDGFDKHLHEIQRGVLTPFGVLGTPITHGAAVFLAVTDAQQARGSLAKEGLASEAKEAPADGVYRNLAFTHSGLRRLGMSPDLLQSAPPAFREGAAARAGSVGDLRAFHPSNWQPIRRNWKPAPDWEVELAQVDALVQLRATVPGATTDITDPNHPLHAEIDRLNQLPGLALLAVEGLAPAGTPGSDVDHLGFRDGVSQPTVFGEVTRPWSDLVQPGALLVGRGAEAVGDFWLDGSFLAVRRMTVDRARFDALLAADSRPGLNDEGLLAAKLLGRRRDGTRLGSTRPGNNFVFDGDEAGAVCPLDSHIRRANPRRDDTPRIMRRGMSFGPPVNGDSEADGVERGTFFMAYCADLAEQYERILGWVNGGNSTRAGSYLPDPLSGVPDHNARTYRFLHDGSVQRVVLKEATVGLSWSLYFFAPSLLVIKALDTHAAPSPDSSKELVERGRAIIAQMAAANAEAWRALLNEPGSRDSGVAEAIWAAIRAGKGILDTPAGYLVGSYDLVLEVLRDDGGRFSNRGAGERMEQTIGQFHLGLDPKSDDYVRLSKSANAALRSVGEKEAFERTRAATKAIIARILELAALTGKTEATIDLLANLIEPALAAIAEGWFGIPDETHIVAGAHDWTVPDNRAPRYPGDFWNASRHAFNPFLSPETERMAIVEGQAAVAAVADFIQACGRYNMPGSVSAQMAKDQTAYPQEADLARVLVGCLIGGVPTVAGNAVRLLVEGLETGDLDRAQAPWLLLPAAEQSFDRARAIFGPKIAKLLALKPVPEVLWRRVVGDNVKLGEQPLEKGRTLIFSLESAGQDRFAGGATDNYIPFGMAQPGTPPTPHGCPGREMAIGTMLGLVVGLLEAARFRPSARGMAELRPLA